MNSSVIGTIELTDQPIESLAPPQVATLPERIRQAYSASAPGADFAIVTEEVLEADLTRISSQLRLELGQILQAIETFGSRV